MLRAGQGERGDGYMPPHTTTHTHTHTIQRSKHAPWVIGGQSHRHARALCAVLLYFKVNRSKSEHTAHTRTDTGTGTAGTRAPKLSSSRVDQVDRTRSTTNTPEKRTSYFRPLGGREFFPSPKAPVKVPEDL